MEANLPPHIMLILLLGGGLILFAPRPWILPVILALTVFVSMGFHIFIFGLNFYFARLLMLFAWARVLAKGEHRGFRMLPMDRAFILFCGSMVLVETLRRGWPGFVYSAANSLYDAPGVYFLGRILLREGKDIKQVIAPLAVICSVFAGFMLVERLTRHNFLTSLGAITQVQGREGRPRCQATFSHPVLAGTYGAVLLPLFVACWWQGPGMKKFAVLGTIASTVATITSGSSGPLMTYAAVVTGLFMWPFRHRMRMVRWGILLTLLGLHLVMKAPVWALIARVSSLIGGSGYHRFSLLDDFITHTADWWLIGTETTNWGWLSEDVANQYCIIAKHGGLLALVLFIRLLAAGFHQVGAVRNEAGTDRPTEILLWSFGTVLFGHVVTFFGTSYFDQTNVLWYLTLAMIASLHLLSSAREESFDAEVESEAPVVDFVERSQGIA